MIKNKAWMVFLTAAAILGLAACTNSAAQKIFSTDVVTPARLAKASEVTGCRLLGEVKGHAEPSKSGNAPLARMTARDDMLQRAGEMGATHVVFRNFLGNRRPVAMGNAYQCE
jgi:hypothetical protein